MNGVGLWRCRSDGQYPQ